MKAILLVLLLPLASVDAKAVVSGGAPEPMPEVLYSPEEIGDYPVFVGIERVLTKEGKVDSKLFPPSEASLVERLLALPEISGCVRLRSRVLDYADQPMRATLRQAVRDAGLVLIGRVTGLSPGFHGGSDAGTLVQLTPEEFLKTDPHGPEAAYYVFVNNAEFGLAGKNYCQKEVTFVSVPALGERLVIFVPRRATGGKFLWVMDGAGLIRLAKDSQVELPERYRAEVELKALEADGFIAKLRSNASSQESYP